MAVNQRVLHDLAIQEHLHSSLPIKNESHRAHRTGVQVKKPSQVLLTCEGESRASDLTREFLAVKPLPVRNHEKEETAFLVFKKEVFAAETSCTLGDLSPFRDCHDRRMNETRKRNPFPR